MLSRQRLAELRQLGMPACPVPVGARTVHGQYRSEEKVHTIVVGAGPGRVGTTQMAVHLQREGARVTHERWILH